VDDDLRVFRDDPVTSVAVPSVEVAAGAGVAVGAGASVGLPVLVLDLLKSPSFLRLELEEVLLLLGVLLPTESEIAGGVAAAVSVAPGLERDLLLLSAAGAGDLWAGNLGSDLVEDSLDFDERELTLPEGGGKLASDAAVGLLLDFLSLSLVLVELDDDFFEE
jgi:hypothetical protein